MSPVFAPASDQAEYELPEPNRYIAVCLDIEDAPDKGFGPGVKWVFQLIDPNTNLPLKNSKGYDFTLWQWTSTKMGPKARARPIIEALLGRPLENGEVPDSRLLLNKAMVCLVAHEPTQTGGTVARVTSCKPYNAAPAAATVSPPTRPSATQVSADPSPDDVDRALLVQKIHGQMKVLRKLDKDAASQAQSALDDSDLDTAPLSDVENLLGQIERAIEAVA